jgi:polyphosphate kinase 2 (PPK2 family)
MANLEPRLSTAKPPHISPATSAIAKIAKPHRPPKPAKKLKRKLYEKELRKLQVELCHLQQWAKTTGAKIIIVFEGRDAAGKGGTIKAITERVSPRVFRVVALPAPSDREKTQVFMQRYVEQFPLPARSSSSIAADTTVPAWNT